MNTVWGIHMGEGVGSRPIENSYVAIGWPALGDLKQYSDREALKKALAGHYPEHAPGSRPVAAGILFRFVHEMKAGDIVVYPSKHDRMVNVGRFTGSYEFVPTDPNDYPNHRHVEWLGQFSRNDFSQSALNEIGAFITVFLIKTHAAEFLRCAGIIVGENNAPIDSKTSDDTPDDAAATVAVSKQAEITTGDFVVRQIMTKLSGYEFEEFVAHPVSYTHLTLPTTSRV